MPLTHVWDAVKSHFFDSEILERGVAMSGAAVQVEGWFKGELIWLFTKLEKEGSVKSWARESPTGIGRGKVDFKVELVNTAPIIEIKAAFCGCQKGRMWKLKDYVVVPDIKRLVPIQADSRYLVYFVYPAPERGDWCAVVDRISAKVPDVDVTLAECDQSPGGELCIGWLRVAARI